MNPEKDMLLVCAGSGPGRVPFAFVSRDSGTAVIQEGCWLSFTSKIENSPAWFFRILTRDDRASQTLMHALKKKEVYSLSPDDFGVRTIVFRREDWGPMPRWIGGDISAADVDASLYRFGGNNVYDLKEEEPNQSLQPTAPSGRG
jgi:hypothetical protein